MQMDDPMQDNAEDLSDPVRWLSPQSDGSQREREVLASIRNVGPSIEARRAAWEGIESAAKKQVVESEGHGRRRRTRRGAAPLRG
jgi:hypothetical protein